ncbi:hypothetical protein Aduo_007981 [Ancylostoma duodenale]
MYSKLIRWNLLNKQRLRKIRFVTLRTISDIGPLEDEKLKIANRKLFGPELPYGVRDAKDAKYVAEELASGERKLVFDALRKKMADQYLEHKRLGNAEIHHDDILKIWYVSLVPAFVLGVLDTSLLIFSGQSINSTFATVYGLSIMGAAALGNVFTNVVLLQTQIHFGHLIEKFGLRFPVLSAEQMHNKDIGIVTNIAKTIGLLFGSLCGMFPLLLYDNLTQEELERKKRAMIFRRTNSETEMMDPFSEQTTGSYKESEEDRIKRLKEAELEQRRLSQSIFDEE